MIDTQTMLEGALRRIRERDPEISAELDASEDDPLAEVEARLLAEKFAGFPAVGEKLVWAAYQYRLVRPVLTSVRGKLVPVRPTVASRIWQERLDAVRQHVARATKATGRIEVIHHEKEWIATAFLVREDVIATNHHVANDFSRRKSNGELIFKLSPGGDRMIPSIDFLEEDGVEESLVFDICRPLHLKECDRDPDLAFLQVRPRSDHPLPEPLELFTEQPEEDRMVFAVGYPARDSRILHADLMDRTFGKIYDKKRVSPGRIRRLTTRAVVHDCSVLGGSSGSPVIDLETGRVVGVHAQGEFAADCFAVQAAEVDDLMGEIPIPTNPCPVPPPFAP